MIQKQNNFISEMNSFIGRHKLLCGVTLGLAVVIYAIGNLLGRTISWIGQACGIAKKTSTVAEKHFQKSDSKKNGETNLTHQNTPTTSLISRLTPPPSSAATPKPGPLAAVTPPSSGPIAIAPAPMSSTLSTPTTIERIIDPMSLSPLDPNFIEIDGVKIGVFSLSAYITTHHNDFTYSLPPGHVRTKTEIVIWRNAEEYLSLLKCLHDRLIDDQTQKEYIEKINFNKETIAKLKGAGLDRTAEIKALSEANDQMKEIIRIKRHLKERIEGYEPAKVLIESFNKEHPDFCFMSFLELLYQGMSVGYGAMQIFPEQRMAFDGYFMLRTYLPDAVRRILLPMQAQDRLDNECIRSAASVLRTQIKRLEGLGFHRSDRARPKELSVAEIRKYTSWFQRKYIAETQAPRMVRETRHWSGSPISSTEISTTDEIKLIVHSVQLEPEANVFDLFAFALMEKHRRDPTEFARADQLNTILRSDTPFREKREQIKPLLQLLIDNHPDTEYVALFKKSGYLVPYLLNRFLPSYDGPCIFEAALKAGYTLPSFFSLKDLPEIPKESITKLQLYLMSGLIKHHLHLSIPSSYLESPPSELFEVGLWRGDLEGFPQVFFDKTDGQLKLALSID